MIGRLVAVAAEQDEVALGDQMRKYLSGARRQAHAVGLIGSISDESLFLTLPTRVLTGHIFMAPPVSEQQMACGSAVTPS
jgi:hypothetical protein